MITYDEALKKFEGETMEIMPTDKKRICIPVHNHVGSQEEEFTSWDGSKQKAVGYKFKCENDGSDQLATAQDGVLMCYEGTTPDGRVRSEAVKEYLDTHPLAAKTKSGVAKLVEFLNEITKEVRSDGVVRGDVYSTDLGFVSKKIVGAPAKEDIKPGQMIVGQKAAANTLKAIRIAEGVEFEGAPGTASGKEGTQKARKGGAYLVQDTVGDEKPIHLIQLEDFKKAYIVTKMPKGMAREGNVNE